ncbi:MAG: hypothetical protein DMF65_09810 [Acidobacteria bacterium]|nr:MAG: hypothetical protein DMF65_09810 [Acidobacteriota bacterium]
MKRPQRRIVITGFMAAGKTSVARALARLLGCEMIDLDEIISEQEKRSIHDLITERGEEIFRQTETQVLRALLEKNPARVIATGGGTWTVERNRGLIEEHDCVTVREKGTRPLAPDRQATHRLYSARRTLYELASLRVEVAEEKSADETAVELLRTMRRLRFVKG